MRFAVLAAGVLCFAWPALAQENAQASDAAVEPAASEAQLLTDEELQTLVAPVALYPDTLLIQIFVAATQPLEIVKAERFLLDNAGRAPAELEPEIEAMGWDPSVTVLATAFPEVVGEMATHIDWTETMGTAMLAQSEDVLEAVQVMRDLAIDSGALVSGEEQTVEVIEDETIVITPTDPDVVYVPQYVVSDVYTGPSAGDVLGTALLTFGIVALIDEIFDDDDDWHDYWGCRNCGGWNGNPIVRNPNVDIDIDGNVNIGDDIGIGNRPDIGWKPDPDRVEDARDKIANRERPEDRPGTLPVDRPAGRTDQLREQLSERTGAADISRPEARDRAGQIAAGAGAGAAAGAFIGSRGSDAQTGRPQIDRGNVSRDRDTAKAQAVAKTRDRPAAAKPAVKSKPKVAKTPQKSRTATPAQRKPKASKGAAMKKKSGGKKAHKASARGKASKAKMKRR